VQNNAVRIARSGTFNCDLPYVNLINVTKLAYRKYEATSLRAHELNQLKALPLFSEMTAQSLESLLDAALLQQFPTGVTLIHEGEPADFLHVLVDGLVEIFTEQTGGEWGISLVNPVSTFILAAVVSDQPYLNSARTLADSRVLLIPAQRVREVFDQDVAFARIVARELAIAYRSSIKKLKGYMARSSVERLANWILTEARRDAAQGNIVIPFDRGTLASHIGTTRENLSRSLALLTEHGVRIRGREIVIDSKEQLEAFARPQQFSASRSFCRKDSAPSDYLALQQHRAIGHHEYDKGQIRSLAAHGIFQTFQDRRSVARRTAREKARISRQDSVRRALQKRPDRQVSDIRYRSRVCQRRVQGVRLLRPQRPVRRIRHLRPGPWP
jgi:CRP/FNR family transcriptional regulator, transcriptional activator FtrB